MEFILTEILFSIVGWFYMVLKYRNAKQRKNQLMDNYENQYSSVGRDLISSTLLILFAVLILIFIVSLIGVLIIKK